MPYALIGLLAVISFAYLFMRSISPACSPAISTKDIGKQFKRVDDAKFGEVLQDCEEEARFVRIPNDVLSRIPKGKPVQLISIVNSIPVFN